MQPRVLLREQANIVAGNLVIPLHGVARSLVPDPLFFFSNKRRGALKWEESHCP